MANGMGLAQGQSFRCLHCGTKWRYLPVDGKCDCGDYLLLKHIGMDSARYFSDGIHGFVLEDD